MAIDAGCLGIATSGLRLHHLRTAGLLGLALRRQPGRMTGQVDAGRPRCRLLRHEQRGRRAGPRRVIPHIFRAIVTVAITARPTPGGVATSVVGFASQCGRSRR